ncbi:hypothetical protein M9Y10_036996 [Tritrichomonas musculus]|uniref:Uncharacterized protein n=1 Tax=Tritrichomonas musculus TaxID=1915356 RepID=A0ABR2GUS9_9EUKA
MSTSKISRYHLSDPTINEYQINTTNKGNFNMILNLIKFNENTFTNDDLPFLVEIIENLESTTLNVTITQETENSSISDIKNTLAKLQFHQKFPHFYIDQITKEIELISEQFYEIAKSEPTWL